MSPLASDRSQVRVLVDNRSRIWSTAQKPRHSGKQCATDNERFVSNEY
jgi:hypothetical protein